MLTEVPVPSKDQPSDRLDLRLYDSSDVTDIAQDFAPKGLSADTVRFNSAKKEEPEETAEVDAEVLETATTAGGAILGKDENVAGMSWPAFRTQVFSRIEKKEGKEVAQSVADAFFGSDDGAATLSDALGYKKAGLKVVPA